MLNTIKELYKFGPTLLGSGYNNALEYINMLIGLEIQEFKSGTQFGTWTVPDEWIVRDAWVKFNGEKILDYKENPLCLMVYSVPFQGKLNKKEFMQHLYTADEKEDSTPYEYSFYERKWGFCMPKNKIYKRLVPECEGGTCPLSSKIDAKEIVKKFEDLLQEGEYEVFIDTEFKPGIMKVGVHKIPGKVERETSNKFGREILLFAHLDHPYQAVDNMAGVACLIDLAGKLKDKFEHTIKIIFCPETIGSIAYGMSNKTEKVDFVIAVDAIGVDNSLLIQKAYNRADRINFAVHLAVAGQGIEYRKGEFRLLIGSDEYFFNDPLVGIPGIMLSHYPYPEYHTSADTPDIIKEEKLKEVQDVILKTIEIYEKDILPRRKIVGPLMRSKFGIQSSDRLRNRDLDYLFYDINGEKWLSELVLPLGMSFDNAYEIMIKLREKKVILIDPRRKRKY